MRTWAAIGGTVTAAVVVACAAFAPALPAATSGGFALKARAIEKRAGQRLAAMERGAPAGRFAYYTRNGGWRYSGPTGWAAAYHPGGLWSMYQVTGADRWRDAALRRQSWIGALPITAESQNIGALFYPSFVRGYRLTGRDGLRRRALQASGRMAARFDPDVGAMLSRPGPEFNVIMDSLMKSQLLWWAAQNGGPARFETIADAHALTIARDLVRPDGSTWHMAYYDAETGHFVRHGAGSAYSVDTTWARGQAWAMLGFPAAYRETRDARFLDAARSVSDWYLAHVPEDMVPYWDFGAPDIPLAPRDSSSAAIAASGLAELALLDPDEDRRAAYADAARRTVESLMAPAYSSSAWTPSLLLHGTYSVPKLVSDCGLAYGDAFFLEALLRLRRIPPEAPALPLARARARTGAPTAAVDGDLATSWSAKGLQSLDLRLSGTQTLGAVRVAIRRGDDRAARLRFSSSSDGRHWRLMAQSMTSGEWAGYETFDVAPREARWVRISCDGTTRGAVCRIAEAQVLAAP